MLSLVFVIGCVCVSALICRLTFGCAGRACYPPLPEDEAVPAPAGPLSGTTAIAPADHRAGTYHGGRRGDVAWWRPVITRGSESIDHFPPQWQWRLKPHTSPMLDEGSLQNSRQWRLGNTARLADPLPRGSSTCFPAQRFTFKSQACSASLLVCAERPGCLTSVAGQPFVTGAGKHAQASGSCRFVIDLERAGLQHHFTFGASCRLWL